MKSLEEKLDLNEDQKKAFKRLERAFKDCKKLGVRFEQSHETLIALNKKYIVSVEESNGNFLDNEICLEESSLNRLQIGVTPWIDVPVAVTVK